MEKTVFFRTFEESDAELVYQWMNDDQLKEMTVGLNRRMSYEESLNWKKVGKIIIRIMHIGQYVQKKVER